MQLHKYFTRKEFACKCGCGFDTVDAELLGALISLREHFKSPIIITSGNRCKRHNAEIGGSENSQHMKSKAVDLKVTGIHENQVASYLESTYTTQYGIGRYTGRTHLDVRKSPARWNNRVDG